MAGLAAFFALASGCVSIGTYERSIADARRKEIAFARHLVLQAECQEISLKDVLFLLRGRNANIPPFDPDDYRPYGQYRDN